MSFTAVLDANVLLPARVRDVLLTLAEADLYRPLWSERILDEVRRHLPDAMDDAARGRLLEAMTTAFPEAAIPVPTDLGFDALTRINAKDRHVVQAAIFGHADVVVTEDVGLREEGQGLGEPWVSRLDFQGCGEFTANAVGVDPDVAAAALDGMLAQRWRLGDDRWPRFLAWMRRQGWAVTADQLEQQ
ncbi:MULTISPECIES: PIN domain-containing protein [Actinomycetes]|uniref:PIN domain-containing protein n=1 Tax=Actinomycetes TaxID=1760 RepID=UPI00289ED24D|nr:PIN domain-containing protein [Mobilicoccus sp.]